MNYIHTFPDFLTMQKTSFCWFLRQGLREELMFVSRVQDFSERTEYRIFAEEYDLIQPFFNLDKTRDYSGNYCVQLVIPVEIRDRLLNYVWWSRRRPMIKLPLMTAEATFLINGCERVIVSQIIRSPGIYFEKNKIQRIKNPFKQKLPIDITQLRSFLPSSLAFLSHLDLFFATANEQIVERKNKKEETKENRFRVVPHWKSFSSYSYSLIYLQQTQNPSSFYFLTCFKLYKIISKTSHQTSKVKLTQLFLKWLQVNSLDPKRNQERSKEELFLFIKYFNFLWKLIVKYQILTSSQIPSPVLLSPSDNTNFVRKLDQNDWLTKEKFRFLKERVLQVYLLSHSIFKDLQKLVHLQWNVEFFLMTEISATWFQELGNFAFLTQPMETILPKLSELQELTNLQILRPVIYFSQTRKDQEKYSPPYDFRFGTPKNSSKKQYSYPVNLELIDPRFPYFFNAKPDDPRYHNYLKAKREYLLYHNDHEIELTSHSKYQEKELYNATLIPDYGSWIRFSFQKNTKINSYKYPLKTQDEEIMIQLDKVNQKPILALLKEMGFSDLEIYQNLEYADFFYFHQPLLINSKQCHQPVLKFNLTSKYFQNISEFSKIFDVRYYRLGAVGRRKINRRLNLEISERLQTITYEDIFAIIDKLIDSTLSKTLPDDIDHLKNRRVRPVGELLQNLIRIGFQRAGRTLSAPDEFLSFTGVLSTFREFFVASQLSQYLDQINPLASLTHKRRISGLGPGGLDSDKISLAIRAIHPSHYGRICPIETPEGQNVGLISSLTTCARVNQSGFLETPFWRVNNGKVIKTGRPIYLTADIEDFYKIAPADISTNSKNYLTKNLIPIRYQQDFMTVTPSEVDFIAVSTVQIVSVGTSLIPFFEHDDANRALMGSNMQRQSVPLLFPQKPIIGTGLEHQIAKDSRMAVRAKSSGIISGVTADQIIVQEANHKTTTYSLKKYVRSNQKTCIHQRPIVWEGEKIQAEQMLTDGPSIRQNELSLGQNVLVGYMPWQGYNFEDAILISERLLYEDLFTSIHIQKYTIPIDQTSQTPETMTNDIPNLHPKELKFLNEDGVILIGTFVKPNDILVGKTIANNTAEQLPEAKLLRAIFGVKATGIKDNSYRMPEREYGRVIKTLSVIRKTTYQTEKIYVFVAQIRKIKVGDKIAGRHGNKGIISRILPRQDMPFLPDGTPIDIILNPLGVPSRMNVGQLYECLLGLAGDKLNVRFKILPFDEMYGLEASRILINKKLRQASIFKNESWLFNPYCPGKMVLIDGRTGIEFENPITVGNAYMLKLIHLVDDKMHARATGPYSLITQQPLRGKAHQGGQRFGEMEVWALEGFGAAWTLTELLTIKSDDIEGRNETLSAIVKGHKIPKFGVPESLKVLLQELRSIGLDISTYQLERLSLYPFEEKEVNLMENYNPASKTFSPTFNRYEISF